ncbi:hypothetical protein [Streptomyces sp. NPDC089919]|uniref:hypothetical protein n=1 Tax=Streptomyces sp. NPDC089919 TaxID=3155188 RepID=UPI0034382C15
MSTATFTPIQGGRPSGAATVSDPHAGAEKRAHARPRPRGILHAAKVFAGTAVSVVLLGEYAEDAGVIRR